MPTLPSLPTELICEILGHLQPLTKLYEYNIAEEDRWDIRHWGRTLTAVARTCRLLHDIAVPLLYSRYEGAFHNPVIHLIDSIESSPHQGLKHIAIRRNGDSSEKYTPTQERVSRYRAWADISELKPFEIKETQELSSEDAGQIELWRLISRAPKLESLHVTTCTWLGKTDHGPSQPPMWLIPVLSAVPNVTMNPRYNGWFRELHSLTIHMNGMYGTWIFHLFSLPCLQSLSMMSMGSYPLEDWATALTWPEATSISSVRDLSLINVAAPAHVITRMAGYCKTLKSFKCDRAYERIVGKTSARPWCVEILNGLQRHKETLSSLALDPYDRLLSGRLWLEYKRLEGFKTLVALESLHVPWYILMGSPECFQNDDIKWEPLGYWEYPMLRDVLPGNLRALKTSMTAFELPVDVDLEEGLCSGLPPDGWEDDVLLLKSVDFSYNFAYYGAALPANFWRVQDAFHRDGLTFTYKYKLDPGAFSKQSTIAAASLF